MATRYDKDNPLTPRDKSDINAALARLNQASLDIDFLGSVGHDMGEHQARHDKLKHDLNAFLANYFAVVEVV